MTHADESVLDGLLRGLRDVDGWSCAIADVDAARAELVALRERARRAEDLEMMLRKALDYSGAASLRRHGNRLVFVQDIGAPIYLDDDGTGLPVLTDAARSALARKEGP